MRFRAAPAGVLLAAFACNDDPSSAPKSDYPVPDLVPTGEVVAEIGPVVLTTDELEERIRLQNPLVRTRLGDPKELRRFVEAEVRNELLALVGWDRGLFDDPEVQRALRQAVVRKLISREAADVDQEIEISDAEIVALYKEREDQYFRPERVRLSRVVKPTKNAAEKARTVARFERLADKVRVQQKRGRRNAFAEVAREITGETGAARSSVDQGFQTREEVEQEYGAEVAQRIFEEMTVGDVTVVPQEGGVALVAKTGRRGEVSRSLESVKPSLVSHLRAQKRSELLEKRVQQMAKERGISLEIENLDAMAFGKVPAEGEGEGDAPEK